MPVVPAKGRYQAMSYQRIDAPNEEALDDFEVVEVHYRSI